MKHTSIIKTLGLSIAACGLAVASAAELPINPGLWETTTTGTNPMTGKNETKTETECVKERSISTAEFMQDEKSCKATKDEVSGNTLSFAIQCTVQGVATEMSGSITADDNSSTGNMNIAMTMGGQTRNMDMKWTAKRLGSCDE
ncbi:DUF3617 domain-containing protein [Pleionea litopenaei]|uniref:DUF3617 family protein n=1 Tax=Pleionea litopenaei TaxID=3070815 RepID=A0AA51X7N5_9GAMM|nr:DUF3617 family protein [Pleionea sp. HL-JVS1]WMS88403.1 DUF3617 family protein [Pleionea sp. HL-JVS1]